MSTIVWRHSEKDEQCTICKKTCKGYKGYILVDEDSYYICEDCGNKNYPDLVKKIDRMSFD